MDRAFATLAQQTLGATEHVHPRWEWVREYPLSPGLLAVTHVWRDHGRHVIVATKGAPEAIIDLCHLAPDEAALWRDRADAMARDGLRVLGVARARHPAGELPTNPHDYAFEIVGLVGLADPLREETTQTIATCRTAGVRVIMITGDHPTTARAIAQAAGLRGDELLTGPELEALDDDTLAQRLEHTEVIARAAPAHKLRIIRALRADGHVVAMTGDGVNDAPALKAADVGVAMGHGTDVAREAAGLVILDDSLAAIEAAIRTGRTIYDNLRSVAIYLLAVHVPIAGLALIPPLFGWPLILAPLHIVLLELVVDPTCSIVFELDPPSADVMQRPPRGRSEHLFEPRRVAFALVLGIAALAGPLAVIAYLQLAGASAGLVRTLGFVALIAANLSLVVAVHGRPHRRTRTERNRAIRWMTLAVATILALAIFLPPARSLFSFAVVDAGELAGAILAGVLPVLAVAFLAPGQRTGMPDARLRGMRAVLLAMTVLAGCQTADAIEAKPAKEPPPEERFERDMLVRFHMHENIGVVRTIEKRLVHGRLDEARDLARALADAPDEPGLGPWSRHQIAVRERAGQLARAKTVEEACDAEARMAIACAGCHVAANVTPELRPGPQPTDDGTVQRRMARHVWATDRIWEGIVAGDDESALSGLGVLAETPLKEPTWAGDRARAALELQQRAAEARKRFSTDTQEDRAHAYARLLVTCSSCHLQAPQR
jgi:soluble P-type ATPase